MPSPATRFRLALFAGLLAVPFALAEAPTAAKKDTVPVAMYMDKGAAGKGPKMLEDKFAADTEFRITRLMADDIREGKLSGYKVLILPGGSSSREGKTLGADGREAVKKWVESGGVYVGICAGCFLASCEYDWSLHILPATIVDRANSYRGRAELKLEPTAAGRDALALPSDPQVKVVYHNGPVLKAKDGKASDLIPLAMYREEITKKGAKEGLMIDTPAVAAARYGKGWAIGVSPHPEQTEGMKDLVPAAIRWALKQPTE